MKKGWWISLLLLRKAFIVRKRHYILTLVEILFPVLIFILILNIKGLQNPTIEYLEEDGTYFPIVSKRSMISMLNRELINIYYVPRNNFTINLMDYTRDCLALPNDKIIGFTTEENMIETYIQKQFNNSYSEVLAIVFDVNNTRSVPMNLKYILRSSKALPSDLFHGILNALTDSHEFVKTLPVTAVQMCLDESFINISAPQPTFQTELSIQQMPITLEGVVNQQSSESNNLLVYPTVIVFLASFLIEPTYVAVENSIGIDMLMATTGVRSYQNLLSWIISGMMLGTVYISLVVVELKLPLFTDMAYLQYGNGFLLWLALFLNLAHWIANGLHIGAYFSKPHSASIGLCLWLIATLLIYRELVSKKLYTVMSCLGILMPCSMLISIFKEINAYEFKLIGVQWSYLFTPGSIPSAKTTSLGVTMMFSILGIILHVLLAIYVHAIFPGKYGVARHPLFFLQRTNKNRICNQNNIEDVDDAVKNDKRFETISKGVVKPGIQIRNLKMTYSSNLFHKSTVEVLKGLSVDFYEGLITSLLGHNGAGKTTLMSIITGLTNPNDGSVFINGKNVSHDLDSIQKDLGVCSQDNILFPDLTVYEHIEFFAKLKGDTKTNKQIKKEVDSLLSNLGITARRNFVPKKLSGAQKRRLCLGIALAGDASVLILDEPTSGMDPEGRRYTWDLLLKLRGKKTIIITTHSIDEADILGDRIAIMHTGRMISYGTSMFLKKLYGHGRLEVTLSTESWSDSKRIQDAIGLNAQVRSLGNGRIALSIPPTEELPRRLDNLEQQKKQLGVTGISLSIITLEQVFLMITEEEEEKKEELQLQDSIDSKDAITIQPEKLTGWKFSLQIIFTLIEKKITFSVKNQWIYCFIVFISVVGIGATVIYDKKTKEVLTLQSVKLDVYGNSQTWYSSDSEILDKKYRNIVESYNSIAKKVKNTTNINEVLYSFAKTDFPVYRNSFIVAAEFNVTQGVVNANGLFSGMATRSIPITVNLLSNTLIKSLAGDDYSIDISVLAFPDILSNYKLDLFEITVLAGLKTSILIHFLFLAVCLFVKHPLQENAIGVKHLQRMTGISGFSYWAVIYVIDLLLVLCTIFLMIVFVCLIDFQVDIRLYRINEISIIIVLLLLFFMSSLPIVYSLSFLRKSSKIVILTLFLVPVTVVSTDIFLYLIAEFQEDDATFKKIYWVLHKIFLVIPHVSFSYGYFDFMKTAALNARCRSLPKAIYEVICMKNDMCCKLECADGSCKKSFPYFNNFDTKNSLEENMIYLAVAPLLYFLVLGLLEQNIFIKLFTRLRHVATRSKEDQDEVDGDVKVEEDLIARAINIRSSQGKDDQALRLSNMSPNCENPANGEHDESTLFLAYRLRKNYGKVKAVKNVSFRVKKHECFGFLGVNGAGKSATFRMLTGEELPSGGVMLLGSYNIQSNRKKYLEQMGYCPQSHDLIPSLNAWEHLRLFAGLRGIPRSCINQEVAKWINLTNLKACAKQPSKTYSGGNKRRLSIAIALIGGPPLVLLDEPTTGVDPAARKSLWKVIRSCQATGQAIIFTSHNMEESEALCDRLVIMVDGILVCVGASQQLKQTFGAGFDISIKLNPQRDDTIVKKIKDGIECALTCTLRDENIGYLAYHVDNPETTWQTMFQALDNLKKNYEVIEDFIILSSTLEQLFMQFARTKNNFAQNQSTVQNSSMNVIANRGYMP
ncbi:ATP-binding cassette sub-family A member 1 isoform X2 [Cephus cinctus]|nr:ATP-binding cassette sub-family A member 1 isoform X2 [Cephus cinctus]XP_015588179.1 ATP-binding cassette sub-family A member 1 isoform X2 [Cephus cinctus]XP_015588180.1 ATP-binding cassette sub-family A member 1 isoform X2 [Cephus cinctus]XP_024937507.1 ATP-binding cassette sub-family A member 1 isoform X2 [Cephus cinctus]